jgi:hypothetical protein
MLTKNSWTPTCYLVLRFAILGKRQDLFCRRTIACLVNKEGIVKIGLFHIVYASSNRHESGSHFA